MAFLLALLSSALWGSADFQAGRMSKKYQAFAVLGITQLIGLAFGIFLIFATGERGARLLGRGFPCRVVRGRCEYHPRPKKRIASKSNVNNQENYVYI
jgi:hypothetical protein